jgi:hypothetical protein
MVQFKPVDTVYRKTARSSNCSKANNYWKLGYYRYKNFTTRVLVEYLKSKGYVCRNNMSRSFFIDA